MTNFSRNFANRMNQNSIKSRLKILESKTKKSKKGEITLNQQLLMLHELDIMPHFRKLGLTDTKLGELLGVLLNGDIENTRKALSKLNSNESKAKTATNYEFLSKTFANVKLDSFSLKCEREFNRIVDSKTK